MMLLQHTLPRAEYLNSDRFEFLKSVVKLIKRVDELHASEEVDSSYVFIIWLVDPCYSDQVFDALSTSLPKSTPTGWQGEVFDPENGLLIVILMPNKEHE